MINTLIFVLCLVIGGASPTVHCIQDTLKGDKKLEEQLKLVDKSPIKTIHVFYIFLVKLLYTLLYHIII